MSRATYSDAVIRNIHSRAIRTSKLVQAGAALHQRATPYTPSCAALSTAPASYCAPPIIARRTDYLHSCAEFGCTRGAYIVPGAGTAAAGGGELSTRGGLVVTEEPGHSQDSSHPQQAATDTDIKHQRGHPQWVMPPVGSAAAVPADGGMLAPPAPGPAPVAAATASALHLQELSLDRQPQEGQQPGEQPEQAAAAANGVGAAGDVITPAQAAAEGQQQQQPGAGAAAEGPPGKGGRGKQQGRAQQQQLRPVPGSPSAKPGTYSHNGRQLRPRLARMEDLEELEEALGDCGEDEEALAERLMTQLQVGGGASLKRPWDSMA